MQNNLVEEKKTFDFSLVNSELSESRLYRTSNQFAYYTGKEVSDLLYLTTLSIYMYYKDDNQAEYAKAYAKQTSQYGPYNMFRTHGTDLYMLSHAVNTKLDTRQYRFAKNEESHRYLKSLNFDSRTHQMFLNKLSNDSINDTEAEPYFMRLERQLKITDSRYKQWRRLILDWEKLKYIERQNVTTKLLQEFRRLGKGSEMISTLSTMAKYRSYSVSDKFDTTNSNTSLGKTVAATAAGAVAGRYVAGKIATQLGKDEQQFKKIGTGLGAIAGYWASRKKQ